MSSSVLRLRALQATTQRAGLPDASLLVALELEDVSGVRVGMGPELRLTTRSTRASQSKLGTLALGWALKVLSKSTRH